MSTVNARLLILANGKTCSRAKVYSEAQCYMSLARMDFEAPRKIGCGIGLKEVPKRLVKIKAQALALPGDPSQHSQQIIENSGVRVCAISAIT
jgi:hypothetical protein